MDERPYRKRGISEEEGHMDICQYRGRDIGSRELLAGGGGYCGVASRSPRVEASTKHREGSAGSNLGRERGRPGEGPSRKLGQGPSRSIGRAT